MGNNSSRTETINWDKIKTENVETPVHSYLGSNANNLITKLNLPKDIISNNMDTDTEINLLDLKVKSNNLINLDLNSSTSPFISSEKYLSLTKKLENNLNNLNQLGGGLEDESSTSYTEDNKKLKGKNNNKLKSLKLSDRLSYVSSSAHTGNKESEDNSEDNSEDKSEDNSEDNSEEDDDKSDQTTPNNIKKKHNKIDKSDKTDKSDKSDEDMLDDEEEDDDEELMGGSETVYSTTIDNEVNTSDINLV
jgi:cobalamin biosynthesis protein CobT